MKITSRAVRIAALAIVLGLLCSAASFGYFECYPCTQCEGKVCFIYAANGDLIGVIGNSCCTGGQV